MAVIVIILQNSQEIYLKGTHFLSTHYLIPRTNVPAHPILVYHLFSECEWQWVMARRELFSFGQEVATVCTKQSFLAYSSSCEGSNSNIDNNYHLAIFCWYFYSYLKKRHND